VTAFTDAAVAIALTLLVLPLLETVREAAAQRPPLPLHDLLRSHSRDFLAFVVSFLVIERFWRVHRRLFDAVTHLDEGLSALNMAWLFGIVFLPVPTAVLVVDRSAAYGAAALYGVNLVFIALSALALTAWIARHPDLWDPETDEAWVRGALWRGVVASVLMAVVVPGGLWLGPWALLLLLLLPVSQRLSTLLTRRLASA
jgi:uncharacterized membrane protein